MSGILFVRPEEAPCRYENRHAGYEYLKRKLVSKGAARQCTVSRYEIPPGKSAYPYHYHTKNEESFYILSGEGVLRTPDGERAVSAGDFIFFPADETGAHKLSNSSESEPLVYLDFDTFNEIDVAFYPDSGKVGIWGKNINQIYRTDDQVGYFQDE